MSNDFEVREVRATANDHRPDTADEADDRTQPPDIVDAEIIDPDAAIIDESPDSGGDAPDRDQAAGAGADRPGPSAAAELAGDAGLMHERWTAIQATFVDDPRGSVAAAADLTAEAIGTLVAAAQERERGLRGEWDRDGVDTEGLRQALRNYRGFLDHLVSV
jgi:hypothetical protein